MSDQFVKIREIFEKKEEKKLSDVPKSSEYKALQSESQNQPVKKSISTRSTKKTPMGAVKSPPRKKTNYCKVLSSKVKKTPSKGEIKGAKEKKKGVQDIRKFFEGWEGRNKISNSKEKCTRSLPENVNLPTSREGIIAQPKDQLKSMANFKGSGQDASKNITGLSVQMVTVGIKPTKREKVG